MSGHKGAEILYLDDRAENIEGARKLGWRVHLHSDPKETLDFAARLGLPV